MIQRNEWRQGSAYVGAGLLAILTTTTGPTTVPPDPGPPDEEGWYLRKDSTVEPGSRWAPVLQAPTFYDAVEPPEAPTGTDGTNGITDFTLPAEPDPEGSLIATVEGVVRYKDIHYHLIAGGIMRFLSGYIPLADDRIVCWFRVA